MKKAEGDFMKMREVGSNANESKNKLELALKVMKDVIDVIKSLVQDSMSFLQKLVKDKAELEKLYILAKKINTESKDTVIGKEIKGNRHCFMKYTEEKQMSFEEMKVIWKKITGEEYAESGPMKVAEKKEGAPKKTAGKTAETKKGEEEKKGEEKKGAATGAKGAVGAEKKGEEKKEDKYKDKDLEEKVNELQVEVEELRKSINEIKKERSMMSDNNADNAFKTANKNEGAGNKLDTKYGVAGKSGASNQAGKKNVENNGTKSNNTSNNLGKKNADNNDDKNNGDNNVDKSNNNADDGGAGNNNADDGGAGNMADAEKDVANI